ncbi:2067_t:CDS:1, partial [Gigaspora margarita]
TMTSIKVIDFDFETMLFLDINFIIIGTTTQTDKNVRDDLALDFYMKERIREKELPSFWVQAKYNASNRYLFTRTNAINQTFISTTTLLIGTITY